MGTTSLVHAIGVNKYTKRTQMRMSHILNGSCVLSKSIESIENVLESGARDLYCVNLGINARQELRIEHNRTLDFSIIGPCKWKWYFDLAPDALTLRLHHAIVPATFRRDRRFRSSFVIRYHIRSCTFILSHPGCTRR